MFKIKLLDLKREYLFLRKEINTQIKDSIRTQDWVLGRKVEEFEERAAKYLGVKYTVGVNSGTDALLISLRSLALKIKRKEFFEEKDEIITPAFTFLATAEAIVRAGASPHFVDIDLSTFTIDPDQIEKAITKNTVGILPVHLYGFSCVMERILNLAQKYNLFVVEDCAQALGAEFKNKKVGSFADLGAFSFFPSKNLGAWGDAGLIATNSKHLAKICKALRNHGQFKKYDAEFLGYNSRLDSLQAAILLAKFKYLNKFNSLRKRVARIYDTELSKIEEVEFVRIKNQRPVYHLYPIRLATKRSRDRLLEFLNSQGIQARIYYPKPIYKMKAYESFKKSILNNTEEAVSKSLCLPVHPFLKEEEVFYVVGKIKEFFFKK
ncbi:MAG: hypothetical protein DRP61_00245 [Candidatus Omnitrophota bacterium]|nr:MAG: hypothetical protein DRP61_00245 [Candidatus Omnitrophota bacterium]RKY35416.1 MAG: hypothetical protein DRP69_01685 [Candidatus Omnitrophota bacterium]RKY44903.1 MAG: hypothetical protein DRP80_00910 [Candidatus Omnitrophota bacterium]